MDWYYIASNQQIGPIDEAAWTNLVSAGTVNAETLVWHEGMTQWQRYGDLASGPVLTAVAAPAPAATGGIVCSECGQTFSSDEVIRHGNRWVCAGCKPVFIQKLKEGVMGSAALEYAGFWTRFAASFVDGIILWFINMAVMLLWMLALRTTFSPEGETLRAILIQFILMGVQLAIGVTYEVWFIGKYGATPGKMACKIKVVTPEGAAVTYGRAFGRYFAKLLSGLILCIGYIMAAFDDEKRALHDRICDTRVIKAS
jgi:uncharacterized RDD family membrane protein YckC